MTTTTPIMATRTVLNPDGTLLQEWASQNSVELVSTVKDGWRVASVKVYDVSELVAAERAVAAALHAETLLKKALQ